jgi:hypothetical protein
MARKSLTFKSPDKVKLLTLLFVLGIIFSPSVRYATATVLHTTADILSSDNSQQ